MKKSFKFLLAGACVLGLTACSSEEPNPTPNETQGDLYTTITLNFGQGTRSTTTGPGASSEGEEEGTLGENNIDKILVVLATEENGTYTYVTHSLTGALRNNNAINPTYVVRFETQDLFALAGTGNLENPSTSKTDKQIYVFTYCNPTKAILAQFPEDGPANFDPDATYSYDRSGTNQDIIWDENHFLMTNAQLNSAELPSQYDLINVYNKETNPWNLGLVKVQRTAVRFDIASKPAENGLEENQYAITNPVTGSIDAYITMDGVALFNEAKKYYGFMHTSEDGSNTDWALCGKDDIDKWVVSPYYAINGPEGLRAATDFNFYMDKLPQAYEYTSISEITAGRKQNWTGTTTNKRDYYFWTYTTPNTMPGISNQLHGNTTGVIYRAYITAADANTALKTAMEAGNDIYAFEGVMFGDTTALHAYVKTQPASAIQEAFDKTFDVNNNCAVKAGVDPSDNGFSVYKKDATAGKYYCYYYYYNRHNNNGNDGVMGIMEFATVRNNVYKLYVSTVLQYGKPGDKPDDPKKEDETPETYFKVSVEVLPWVVRTNEIIF